MKQTILHLALTAVLMVFGNTLVWADGFAVLTVDRLSGDQATYQLSDIQKITFNKTSMILHQNDGNQTSLPLFLIAKMSVNGGNTAIDATMTAPSGLQIKDGKFTVTMVADGIVTLYDAGGKQVRSLKVKAGQNSLELGTLQKGVYIVKVNGTSQKFLNK